MAYNTTGASSFNLLRWPMGVEPSTVTGGCSKTYFKQRKENMDTHYEYPHIRTSKHWYIHKTQSVHRLVKRQWKGNTVEALQCWIYGLWGSVTSEREKMEKKIRWGTGEVMCGSTTVTVRSERVPSNEVSSISWGNCPKNRWPQPCHHWSPPNSWPCCHAQLERLQMGKKAIKKTSVNNLHTTGLFTLHLRSPLEHEFRYPKSESSP